MQFLLFIAGFFVLKVTKALSYCQPRRGGSVKVLLRCFIPRKQKRGCKRVRGYGKITAVRTLVISEEKGG